MHHLHNDDAGKAKARVAKKTTHGGVDAERATVKDVAARAGVSTATVSRVLSGDYPVSTATRAKVQRAVRDLDYVANAQARALKGSGPKLVAFVLEDVTGASFAYVAKGVEQQATAEGRLCLVCTTHGDPARELAVIEAMRAQHADAVILVGGGSFGAEHQARMAYFAHALEKSGSRLVLAGRPPLGGDVPATVVEYDNEGGAYGMTSYVLSQGHRQIVFLGAQEDHTTSRDRVTGFTRAHQAYGLPAGSVLPGVFTRESGYAQARRLLDSGEPFTAVFAATDVVASGVLHALREAGRRVPEDVSVVGYDDIPLTLDLVPALTTVHVPTEELGRTAVRLALHPEERQHVVLGTHVVIRDSVARLALAD